MRCCLSMSMLLASGLSTLGTRTDSKLLKQIDAAIDSANATPQAATEAAIDSTKKATKPSALFPNARTINKRRLLQKEDDSNKSSAKPNRRQKEKKKITDPDKAKKLLERALEKLNKATALRKKRQDKIAALTKAFTDAQEIIDNMDYAMYNDLEELVEPVDDAIDDAKMRKEVLEANPPALKKGQRLVALKDCSDDEGDQLSWKGQLGIVTGASKENPNLYFIKWKSPPSDRREEFDSELTNWRTVFEEEVLPVPMELGMRVKLKNTGRIGIFQGLYRKQNGESQWRVEFSDDEKSDSKAVRENELDKLEEPDSSCLQFSSWYIDACRNVPWPYNCGEYFTDAVLTNQCVKCSHYGDDSCSDIFQGVTCECPKNKKKIVKQVKSSNKAVEAAMGPHDANPPTLLFGGVQQELDALKKEQTKLTNKKTLTRDEQKQLHGINSRMLLKADQLGLLPPPKKAIKKDTKKKRR